MWTRDGSDSGDSSDSRDGSSGRSDSSVGGGDDCSGYSNSGGSSSVLCWFLVVFMSLSVSTQIKRTTSS